MPRERLSMRKIREVLRLNGLGGRATARSWSIAHSTVRDYLHRAKAAGLTWPLPEGLDVDELGGLPRNRHLEFLFPRPSPHPGRVIPEPDWTFVHTELHRKGVTLRLLWLEHREAHPDGYGYSRFPGPVLQDGL
jgi:transposase